MELILFYDLCFIILLCILDILLFIMFDYFISKAYAVTPAPASATTAGSANSIAKIANQIVCFLNENSVIVGSVLIFIYVIVTGAKVLTSGGSNQGPGGEKFNLNQFTFVALAAGALMAAPWLTEQFATIVGGGAGGAGGALSAVFAAC